MQGSARGGLVSDGDILIPRLTPCAWTCAIQIPQIIIHGKATGLEIGKQSDCKTVRQAMNEAGF